MADDESGRDRRGLERAVMELLRTAEISEGRAAEMLGVDRWALVDIMAAHDVPYFNITEADLAEEILALRAADREEPR